MARNFGKNSEIRIPPESTGPRIINHLYESVTLTVVGGTLQVGYDIVGQTSNATGTIVGLNGNDVLVNFDPTSPVQSFTNGETVNINNAAFTATANSPVDQYVNVTQLVDADNPHNTQRVDASGSAYMRFGEGEQQLDAFGLTRVTQRSLLEAFKFQYSATSNIDDIIVGSATATHLPDESSVNLTTTTGATDSIIRSGEHWYPYVPGVGREAVLTLVGGDSGKANNVRRWGLFDDENGVFWELDGTTINVVVRSNVTGTPTDTKVAQANFSDDVLDGSGGSSNRSIINLDITTYNIFWIDYAWLGTGRIRFGIYSPDGDRLTCHVVNNANANSAVYMTTGSLPVRWENTNTGITSGSSTLKITCAAVIDNAQQQDPTYLDTRAYARINVNTTTETLLFNVRTALTFNSITNRIISRAIQGSTASESASALIRVYENATIGGAPSWSAPTASSPLEIDAAGTFAGGELIAAFMVGVNETNTVALNVLKIHLEPDGTASKTFTVTAESLGGATDVSTTFTWTDQG